MATSAPASASAMAVEPADAAAGAGDQGDFSVENHGMSLLNGPYDRRSSTRPRF